MARKPKRKIIRVLMENSLSTYDFERSLKSLRELVDRLIEQYGEDAELDFGFHEEWNESEVFAIVKFREETDEEYEKRLAAEKKQRELVEDREREEYNRLAKKFNKEQK